MISGAQVQNLLQLALAQYDEYLQEQRDDTICLDGEELELPIMDAQTFEEAGLMTRDSGIVLTFTDMQGSVVDQYQVSIVRSF